jgi:hypothetical protein
MLPIAVNQGGLLIKVLVAFVSRDHYHNITSLSIRSADKSPNSYSFVFYYFVSEKLIKGFGAAGRGKGEKHLGYY